MPKYSVEYTDKKGNKHKMIITDESQELAEEQALYELEEELKELIYVREL